LFNLLTIFQQHIYNKDGMEKLLTQLGLSEKEQLIYKLIVEHGKISAVFLGRLAHINRTTVYSVAHELKAKGLIIEDLGGKTLYYMKASEGELEKIIEREKQKAEDTERSIRELQLLLKNTPESKSYSVPKIRFVDEADLESYLYDATPRWIESGLLNDPTWWGFQDHTFVEHFKKWIVWFWNRAPEKINLKLFSNKSDIEKEMVDEHIDRRQIVFWKGDNAFTSTQWIVGSYIILVVTKEKPFYLVEIHDSVIAHNMREVFKKLWADR
jgi:sugar-specific transcriptional regulator TrmB